MNFIDEFSIGDIITLMTVAVTVITWMLHTYHRSADNRQEVTDLLDKNQEITNKLSEIAKKIDHNNDITDKRLSLLEYRVNALERDNKKT